MLRKALSAPPWTHTRPNPLFGPPWNPSSMVVCLAWVPPASSSPLIWSRWVPWTLFGNVFYKADWLAGLLLFSNLGFPGLLSLHAGIHPTQPWVEFAMMVWSFVDVMVSILICILIWFFWFFFFLLYSWLRVAVHVNPNLMCRLGLYVLFEAMCPTLCPIRWVIARFWAFFILAIWIFLCDVFTCGNPTRLWVEIVKVVWFFVDVSMPITM